MMILQGAELPNYLHKHLQDKTSVVGLDRSKTIGYLNEKGFGVVGFNNHYKDTDIEIHITGYKAWMNKAQLKHMFTYIFNTLNCKRVTARIESKNIKSTNLAKRLGFIKEGKMRGLHIIYYSLLKAECTWVS
jgi:RimJ/RimL family protein N-acetyltransferase